MSKLAKVIVLIVLFFGFMLLLTYVSPSIKQYATELSVGSRLPLWIVGLAAPILLLFQKIGNVLGNIFGETNTEKEVRESNEAIKARLAQVETDVKRIDDWRARELAPLYSRIEALDQEDARLRGRRAALREPLTDLLRRDQEAAAAQSQTEQDNLDALRQEVADLRASMREL